MRVLVIGLTPELPLIPSDALDIADRLVARAANSHTTGMSCTGSSTLRLMTVRVVVYWVCSVRVCSEVCSVRVCSEVCNVRVCSEVCIARMHGVGHAVEWSTL